MNLVSKESRNHITERIRQINNEILLIKKKMREISDSGLSREEQIEYKNEEQERLNKLERKRYELELIRKNSSTNKNDNKNVVDVGKSVTIQFDDEEPETYSIMESSKSSKGILSSKGDLVKALLGKEEGYEVIFNGMKIKVLKIKSL